MATSESKSSVNDTEFNTEQANVELEENGKTSCFRVCCFCLILLFLLDYIKSLPYATVLTTSI